MFLFAVCLVLISKASNDSIDLVAGVENTLDECLAISEAVGEFLDVVDSQDDRRRSEGKDSDLAKGVTKKLGICSSILKSVDSFRNEYTIHQFGNTAIRSSEKAFINKLLNGVSKRMGEVLYVASRDGDAATKFHSVCDNKGPTVVIVETTSGAVFGGYTDVSWASSSTYKTSSTAFLFRLRPSMKHYVIKQGNVGNAVYHRSSYGPTFGGGHDFNIRDAALSNLNSYTNGGHTYTFPTYPSYELTDGNKNFMVKDYVVAKAIAL